MVPKVLFSNVLLIADRYLQNFVQNKNEIQEKSFVKEHENDETFLIS